ncbi:MAG: dTDP-4-dehydrorhamnose reductase [Aquabacterium sp.]
MRLLVLGSQGQVGRSLQRALVPLGTVTGADADGAAEHALDLTDATALSALLGTARPDVIVNAAAYTAVDRAESDPEGARAVNAELPAVLARHAVGSGALLVHYGTDYVFDGSGHSPRDEGAATQPLSVYGRTKRDGEEAIAASGCRHLILRTSWVYSAHGQNFPRTILRLARERDRLRVVADQVGAPTDAELLADMTAYAIPSALARPPCRGLWHVAAAGEVSWHGLAVHVLRRAQALGMPLKAGPDAVDGVSSADYPVAARRPLNSRLDCRRFEQAFGIALPPWQAGIDRLVAAWASERHGP